MRRFCLLVLVLLIPASARAHFHKADAYAAVSVASGSTLVGLHATLGVPVPAGPETGQPVKADIRIRNLSVVGDVSVHWGSDDVTQVNFLGGLRHTFSSSTDQRSLPFVHVLLGGVRTSRAGASDTDPAVAFGAGFEHMLGDVDSGWGFRAQLDYIVRPGDVAPRFSAGVVKRFPR